MCPRFEVLFGLRKRLQFFVRRGQVAAGAVSSDVAVAVALMQGVDAQVSGLAVRIGPGTHFGGDRCRSCRAKDAPPHMVDPGLAQVMQMSDSRW